MRAAQVIRALIDLRIIVPTADMLSIRRSMQYFLQNFQQATQREETIGVGTAYPWRFPLSAHLPLLYSTNGGEHYRMWAGFADGACACVWLQAIGEDLFAIALDQVCCPPTACRPLCSGVPSSLNSGNKL